MGLFEPDDIPEGTLEAIAEKGSADFEELITTARGKQQVGEEIAKIYLTSVLAYCNGQKLDMQKIAKVPGSMEIPHYKLMDVVEIKLAEINNRQKIHAGNTSSYRKEILSENAYFEKLGDDGYDGVGIKFKVTDDLQQACESLLDVIKESI